MERSPSSLVLGLHLVASLCATIQGLQYLHNAVTGEKAFLPDSDAPWELDEHEGVQYLSNGDDSIWVTELLSFTAYKNSDTGHIYIKGSAGNDRLVHVDAFAVMHKQLTFPVQLHGGMSGADFSVFCFDKACKGFRFWWSLFDMVSSIILPARSGKHVSAAWRPTQERWKAWENLASRLQLPPMRKAVEQGATRALFSTGTEQGWQDMSTASGRVLEVPTCVTPMLIAILAKLAKAPQAFGGSKSESVKVVAGLVLSEFCNLAALDIISFLMTREPSLNEAGLISPGSQPVVSLVASAAGFDLTPLKAMAQTLGWADVVHLLEPETGHVSLEQCLGIFSMTPAGMPFLTQLIWMMGHALGATLLKDLKELQATGSCSISPLQLAGAAELSDHEKHRQCAEYMLAGRQACRGRQHISIGLDASRVAFRGRQNIAIVLPDNQGIWCPPQVPPNSYQSFWFTECGMQCLLFLLSLGGLKRLLYKLLDSAYRISVLGFIFVNASGFC